MVDDSLNEMPLQNNTSTSHTVTYIMTAPLEEVKVNVKKKKKKSQNKWQQNDTKAIMKKKRYSF
jgi:hypothetical protein